jgi:hypothetical protein
MLNILLRQALRSPEDQEGSSQKGVADAHRGYRPLKIRRTATDNEIARLID